MKNGKITIHGMKGEPASSIRVNLSFDVPDELMSLLLDEIGIAVDKWQNRIIASGTLKQQPKKQTNHDTN